jgi:hypothetical protein
MSSEFPNLLTMCGLDYHDILMYFSLTKFATVTKYAKTFKWFGTSVIRTPRKKREPCKIALGVNPFFYKNKKLEVQKILKKCTYGLMISCDISIWISCIMWYTKRKKPDKVWKCIVHTPRSIFFSFVYSTKNVFRLRVCTVEVYTIHYM